MSSTTVFGQGTGDNAFDPVESLNYEQARDELIEVVRILELGQMGLDESLKYWERGEALAKRCEEHLAGAARRVEAALQIVGLRDFADSYPATLSGGMAQRASLARALVNRPRLFLLDEPLGKLDALTRLQLQDEILKLWESQRFTAVLVTHDVDEALRLSNRVVVLSERPAHIVADIEVPEHDESSEEVRELRREILSLLGR